MADLSIGARIFEHTASQDLSAGSLDSTTSFTTDVRLSHVMIHLTGTVSQRIKIFIDSANGASFDTTIISTGVASGTDFFYQSDNDLYLENGNELRVTMTNIGTPAVTANLTVVAIQE